ncbi:MAG: hypothetical protein H6592_14540 [Flavobacteriales bacterium]|nr:hypothetical protein [Flavobacteriales bacterium]
MLERRLKGTKGRKRTDQTHGGRLYGAGIHRNNSDFLITLRNISYKYEAIQVDELTEFYASHYIKAYGSDLYPLEKYRAAILRNPNIAFKVVELERNTIKKNRLIGFFDIIPLNPTGSHKIVSGKNRSDKLPLQPEDMANHDNAASCIEYYIGGIASLRGDMCSRAAVMDAFEREFNKQRDGRDVTLYARPVSADGLRLMQTYRFEKLDRGIQDFQSYWYRSVTAGDRQFAPRKRRLGASS